MEVVRYERAGKWYLEPTTRDHQRQRVSVRAAAGMAVWGREHADGAIRHGVPGGGVFDRIVQEFG